MFNAEFDTSEFNTYYSCVYGTIFVIDDLFICASVYSHNEDDMNLVDEFCDYIDISHPIRDGVAYLRILSTRVI